MRVLVTGGAGFIGSHTAAGFSEDGHAVTVLDNLSSGEKGNLPPGCAFVQGDVRDYDLVEHQVRGHDIVIHLAAFTSVPESFERHAECFEVNVEGTLNVLEAAATQKVAKVVFASSSAVYAEEPNVPKTETMCPEPASPYAVSKLEGEHLLAWYHRRRGAQHVALRYFNVYGPRQDPNSDYAAVVPKFINRALAGTDLTIYGDGQQTRDFVYVDDVVRANILAAWAAASGVFNVGTGIATPVLALAHEIIALTGSRSSYCFGPRPPGDVLFSTADIQRISRGFGWMPRFSLHEGLSETLKWYRDGQLVRTNGE